MKQDDCIFNPLRILLIARDPSDAIRVRQCLSQTLSIRSMLAVVPSVKEAQEHLKQCDADVLLVGGDDALEDCARLCGSPPTPPVIALVEREDRDAEEHAFAADVSDILTREPLMPRQLERSICFAMTKYRATRTETLKDAALDIVSASTPGAFCVVDDRTDRFAYFNTRFARLLRIEDEESQLREEPPSAHETFVKAGMPEDRTFYSVAPAEAVGKRAIALPDGRSIDMTIIPVLGSQGARLGTFYRLEEVRKHGHGHAAESESERMFKLMADASPIMIWLMDADGRVDYFNKRWLEYTGQSLEDSVDQGWMARVHPDDLDAVQEARLKAFENQCICSMEFRMRCASGDYRWLHCEGSPRYTDDGAFAGFIGSSLDITEHRRAEMAMREVEKLAATGRMAARIAHEINNPLAGIRNSFLLIKDAIPAEHRYHDYVGRIDRELDRITNVVRQMFELHNPESGEEGLCNVSQAIGDVTSLLQGSCLEHQVRIVSRDCAPDLAIPVIRTGTLRQILFNLVQNAIEASPPGGTIEINASVSEDALTVDVCDEGPGIPEELRQKIYEPFFSTKTHLAHSGLGLGLATCKSLIEAMGGTLSSSTRPGGGTVFHVRLSRRAEESGENSHGDAQPDTDSG